jgi:hypothetical protein
MFVCRTPYFNCPLLTVVFVRTGSKGRVRRRSPSMGLQAAQFETLDL